MASSSDEKPDLTYPVRSLEDRLIFLKVIQDTLSKQSNNSERDLTEQTNLAREKIRQYRNAIDILKSYDTRD